MFTQQSKEIGYWYELGIVLFFVLNLPLISVAVFNLSRLIHKKIYRRRSNQNSWTLDPYDMTPKNSNILQNTGKNIHPQSDTFQNIHPQSDDLPIYDLWLRSPALRHLPSWTFQSLIVQSKPTEATLLSWAVIPTTPRLWPKMWFNIE